MILEIRKRLQNVTCHETKSIADEFNINVITLHKYKNMTEEEIEKIGQKKEYKKRKIIMDGYINIIYKMIIDNVEPEYIIAYIKKIGFVGNNFNLLGI